MTQKQVNVSFAEKKIENEYELLKDRKFQDKQLHKLIDRAMQDLRSGKNCGVKIPKRLWPKVHIQKYNITNLWKYDLPNGWRLIYTI